MKANIVKKAEAKKYYVYELINMAGTVEYVGESINPKERYRLHIKIKPNSKHRNGKFYGRQDIILNVVTYFDNRKEAFYYQCQLQKEYGLITDSEKYSNSGKLVGLKVRIAHSHNIHICPHCNKIGKSNAMFQHHFNNCKSLTIMTICGVKDEKHNRK